MSLTGQKILAAGGTGGRNEVKFFEAPPNADDSAGALKGDFRGTWGITDFLAGGVQSLDFSHKTNRIAIGTAGGTLACFRMRISDKFE
jgi:hypothetical protein